MNPKNPMQPLVKDAHGTIRFKANEIVQRFLDAASRGERYDLNALAVDMAEGKFTQDDYCQFSQLHGYSLCGYHELSGVSDNHAARASRAARRLFGANARGCRDDGCGIHRGVPEEQ